MTVTGPADEGADDEADDDIHYRADVTAGLPAACDADPAGMPHDSRWRGPPLTGREPLLLMVGRRGDLPLACRGLCDLLEYELLTVSDAEELVIVLRDRRPAAVVCEDGLIGITAWFVLARLAHAGCNPDVVVEARQDDPDLRAAFDSCRDLLGLTHVTTVERRLMIDDVARVLASASMRAQRPSLIQLRH